MSKILSRSAWTPTKNGRAGRALKPSQVNAMTIHYPAAGNAAVLAGLSQAQVAAKLRGWRDYHVDEHGWVDIGYNYAIDGSGRTWFLTGLVVGAHANAVGNPSSVGVLFVLGNNEAPTPAMVEAFRELRARVVLPALPRATKVQGHQQVPGNSTACPGKPIMAAIASGVFTQRPAVPTPAPAAPKYVAGPDTRAGVVELYTDWLEAQVAGDEDDWAELMRQRAIVTKKQLVDVRTDVRTDLAWARKNKPGWTDTIRGLEAQDTHFSSLIFQKG